MNLKTGLSWIVGITLATTCCTAPVLAADRVVLKYKVFQRSIPVADLTKLVETGETTRSLRTYIRMARQNPENVRETLNKQVEVNPVTLDRVLNSFAGDAILGQLSDYVYTRSRRADEQAMRAALTLSASNDGRISLLELMQNYPTQEVYVDTERLAEAYNKLNDINGQLGNLLQKIPKI